MHFLCIYTVFVCKYNGLITNYAWSLRYFLCIYTLFVHRRLGLPFPQCSKNLTIGIVSRLILSNGIARHRMYYLMLYSRSLFLIGKIRRIQHVCIQQNLILRNVVCTSVYQNYMLDFEIPQNFTLIRILLLP